MPWPWFPPRGKPEKKAVFSPHCGNETTTNHNRAFPLSGVRASECSFPQKTTVAAYGSQTIQRPTRSLYLDQRAKAFPPAGKYIPTPRAPHPPPKAQHPTGLPTRSLPTNGKSSEGGDGGSGEGEGSPSPEGFPPLPPIHHTTANRHRWR